MSVFSQMDLDKKYEGDPFAEDGDFLKGTAPETGTPATAPPPVVTTAPEDPGTPVPPASAAPAPAPAAAAADKTAEDEEEKAKRKAHEEAEAKRKAEFEARQAAKKAAEQEQLAKLEAMSEEELLTASMKRVSADTEKLTRRNMMECVAEHIQTMCIENPDFARKVMHPRKNMIRCYQYINRKAWEYVQDELKAKNITPSREAPYASAIPEGVCYQWAADYFNDPDAKEDHEDEEKFAPKSYTGGRGSRAKKGKADKKADVKLAKEPPKKAAEPSGQLTLGDFAMPKEKAG